MRKAGEVDAVGALIRLGGIGRAKDIVSLSSRHSLRRAVRAGDIVGVGAGRYAFAVRHAEALALDGWCRTSVRPCTGDGRSSGRRTVHG